MKVTRAQEELLSDLENGSLLTIKDGYYTVVGEGVNERVWPTTFYGLFDNELVERQKDGTYTISEKGRKALEQCIEKANQESAGAA